MIGGIVELDPWSLVRLGRHDLRDLHDGVILHGEHRVDRVGDRGIVICRTRCRNAAIAIGSVAPAGIGYIGHKRRDLHFRDEVVVRIREEQIVSTLGEAESRTGNRRRRHAVVASGVDDHIVTCMDHRSLRKHIFMELFHIVRHAVSGQINVRARRIIKLDPVRGADILINKRILVTRHDLRDKNASAARPRICRTGRRAKRSDQQQERRKNAVYGFMNMCRFHAHAPLCYSMRHKNGAYYISHDLRLPRSSAVYNPCCAFNARFAPAAVD